jgi:hypothetical protein
MVSVPAGSTTGASVGAAVAGASVTTGASSVATGASVAAPPQAESTKAVISIKLNSKFILVFITSSPCKYLFQMDFIFGHRI